VVAQGRDLPRLKAELLKQREQTLQQQTKAVQQTQLSALPVQAIAEKVSAGVGEAWLAVRDDGSTVSIVPVLYEGDAKRIHQQGVIRLLALALQTDFKQYQRNNKALNTLMLAAGAFPCGKALLDEWLCAAVISCVERELWPIRDQATFQSVLQPLPNPVRIKLADSLPLLADLFQLAATLRARIVREVKAKLPPVADDMNSWLDDILAPGFLRQRGLADLRHVRRYLDALRLRLDQCLGNPARELQRMPQWQQWRDKIMPLSNQAVLVQTSEWLELQRLLREWRVAVFAQSIGTDGPVSEKRLDQQLKLVLELSKGKRQ
jgi:ATP-dependent helicase HrpA